MKTMFLAAALLLPGVLVPLRAQNQPPTQDNHGRQENQRAEPSQSTPQNPPVNRNYQGADSQRPTARYHDRARNDDHEWNQGEDRAYRRWNQENHRKYRDFNGLDERDQESYWEWRHNHPDRDRDRDGDRR